MLTFADQENPNLYPTQPSLMNGMKQAGYKTFWITNQQTLTQRNTMLTNSPSRPTSSFTPQPQPFPEIRSSSTEPSRPLRQRCWPDLPRKFIVVHLLGTYMRYDYWYPPEFRQIRGPQGPPIWVTDKHLEMINHYDNAVLYNGFVVPA